MPETRARSIFITRGDAEYTARAIAEIDEDGKIVGTIDYEVNSPDITLKEDEKETLQGLLAISESDAPGAEEEDEDISEEDFEEANPDEEEEYEEEEEEEADKKA